MLFEQFITVGKVWSFSEALKVWNNQCYRRRIEYMNAMLGYKGKVNTFIDLPLKLFHSRFDSKWQLFLCLLFEWLTPLDQTSRTFMISSLRSSFTLFSTINKVSFFLPHYYAFLIRLTSSLVKSWLLAQRALVSLRFVCTRSLRPLRRFDIPQISSINRDLFYPIFQKSSPIAVGPTSCPASFQDHVLCTSNLRL